MKLQFKNYKIIDPKVDEQGIIEAFVAVFGNVDSYGEVIDYGAFKNSLAIKLPKGVWSHNWDEPIAATLEAREVPAGDAMLPESIKAFGGLYIKGKLVLEVQKAAEALALIKNKVIDEFSIGFETITDRMESEIRHLSELRLYEWSPVLVGANAKTELISVKKEEPEKIEPEKKEDKSPACRISTETKEQCISRKIPEILKENPGMTQDQAIAIAESICSKACSEKQKITVSKTNYETIRSAIRALTEALNAGTEADNQVGEKVEHSSTEGGNKKISVTLLNRAVRELLKVKKQN